MLHRYSSRRASLYKAFLKPRLSGASRYDRIAGYFQSSLLELASEDLAQIPRVRIVCNTEVDAEDVKTVRMATGMRRRELLKEKVTQERLKLLIGTDAASTGLNLQRPGCLINLDLPWNPTILEQRKGRVQRGALAKRIPFYNMCYDKGVVQRLFETLRGRIQEITAIFGTVPDFIVDRWVNDRLEDRT